LTAHRARQLLPPDPAGVVLARRMVGRLPLEPGRAGAVKLAVSELVTNSIEHARLGPGDCFELRARVDEAGAVRVEVRDPGPGPPQRPGYGLGWRTVARIADRWGVMREGDRSCVWFELDALR
jgi:anti-sigma regulatory factor (Ser/Thr protein kinase)